MLTTEQKVKMLAVAIPTAKLVAMIAAIVYLRYLTTNL
jgi:hypothetical protein